MCSKMTFRETMLSGLDDLAVWRSCCCSRCWSSVAICESEHPATPVTSDEFRPEVPEARADGLRSQAPLGHTGYRC